MEYVQQKKHTVNNFDKRIRHKKLLIITTKKN